MLDSNNLNNIVCPVDSCRLEVSEAKLKDLLSKEYMFKYQTIKTNR